jgi:hypothetical protein
MLTNCSMAHCRQHIVADHGRGLACMLDITSGVKQSVHWRPAVGQSLQRPFQLSAMHTTRHELKEHKMESLCAEQHLTSRSSTDPRIAANCGLFKFGPSTLRTIDQQEISI